MRRMGVAIWICWLVLVPGAARGDDHRPPTTVLRYGGENAQDGYLHQYCWVTDVEDDVATTECTDKVWDFPRRRAVEAADRVKIRIRKPTEPTEFVITAWPERGDEITGPEGDPESLPVELKPREKDGEVVAWKAVFTVNDPDRHYFIRAGGTWPDEQGASESIQDAFWLFHLRT